MRSTKVIGYETFTSNFNGTDYEMVAIYIARPIENGIKPEKPVYTLRSKVKTDLDELIGEDVKILYNQYGKVAYIEKNE